MPMDAGTEYQVKVGQTLAEVRARLQLKNRMMAEALSNHCDNGFRITPSRVSEAEHGRANLGREYVRVVIKMLEARGIEVPPVLRNAASHLPDVKMIHYANTGTEGNPNHGSGEPPLTVVRDAGATKRSPRKAPAPAVRGLSVRLTGGELVIEAQGVKVRVTSLDATWDA